MVEIVKANNSDIDILTEFQLKMALETENLKLNKDILNNGISSVLTDKNKGCYYLALFENKPVGCLLTTYEWSDWRNSQVLWIQSVYVSPEYRKFGVFKSMYSFIKNIVETSTDFAGIRLYVDKRNVIAQNVYKNIGMNNNHYELFEWIKE